MGMSMCVSPPCFHATVLSIPHVSNDVGVTGYIQLIDNPSIFKRYCYALHLTAYVVCNSN